MIKMYRHSLYLLLLTSLCACQNNNTPAEEESAADPVTPVTVIQPAQETLSDSVSLNATATFLQQSYARANTAGYIQSIHLQPGQAVHAGQLLFTVRTRESRSIGNAVNLLDSSFKFSGVNGVKATTSGYITQLSHQEGDYVQEAEQVAVISDQSSFAFVLNVPFELRNAVTLQKQVSLLLPDSTRLPGVVSAIMPSADSLAQTQKVVIKVMSNAALPENLVAQVRIQRTAHAQAITLPRTALLTDETQSEYWIMRMLDSNTAVKVPVQKGLESNGRVEITAPQLSLTDRILVSGNYGLADTAKVQVTKQ